MASLCASQHSIVYQERERGERGRGREEERERGRERKREREGGKEGGRGRERWREGGRRLFCFRL